MIFLYSCYLLSASRLYTMGAMPPVVENTRGVKDPCSICCTDCGKAAPIKCLVSGPQEIGLDAPLRLPKRETPDCGNTR